MATLGANYPTLADLYRQQDGNGDIATIIDMLAQKNEMLEDALAMECNMGTQHLTTIRTGLPEPTWRRLYEGVQPQKGTTAQVKDTTGMAESWSEIDAKLVELSKKPQQFRLNEGRAHIHGMSNDMQEQVIYGNSSVDPEKFDGLDVRFNDTTAANGNQIVLGDGAGSDNTSIWFITWGEDSVHLLYPEGSKAGLQREDIGKETKENSDGTVYRVYRERFSWDIGLSVRDWRGVSCVRNIDVSNLTNDAATGTDLIDKMIDAYYQLDNANQPDGRTAVYCSRTIHKFLHKQAMNANNVRLQIAEFAGRKVPMFIDIPIRRCDAILETEAAIS